MGLRISADIIGRGDSHPILFVNLPRGGQFQTDLTLAEIVSSIPFLIERFNYDITAELADEILRMGQHHAYMGAFADDVMAWALKTNAPVNPLDAVREAEASRFNAAALAGVTSRICASILSSTSLDSSTDGVDGVAMGVAAE